MPKTPVELNKGFVKSVDYHTKRGRTLAAQEIENCLKFVGGKEQHKGRKEESEERGTGHWA